jgi:hypothetical protein
MGCFRCQHILFRFRFEGLLTCTSHQDPRVPLTSATSQKYMPEITAMTFHNSLSRIVEYAWCELYGLEGPGGDTRQFLWNSSNFTRGSYLRSFELVFYYYGQRWFTKPRYLQNQIGSRRKLRTNKSLDCCSSLAGLGPEMRF